ncbi:hypothetical protein QYM36_004201 [Artemia franciscana]|uniref:Uncharacterized protein n=1 Tax=Artemia franciscana TaxID=6661 RepID=A0AA88I4W6_ARTSF|nr:hypothetical protein QYM36_004201 [Artemia franciscana]
MNDKVYGRKPVVEKYLGPCFGFQGSQELITTSPPRPKGPASTFPGPWLSSHQIFNQQVNCGPHLEQTITSRIGFWLALTVVIEVQVPSNQCETVSGIFLETKYSSAPSPSRACS